MKKLVNSLLLLLVFSLLYWSCGNNSNPLNSIPSDKPTAEIISPINNSDVSDSTVIEVKTSDDKGITHVQIFVDNVLAANIINAPYRFVWNTQSLPDSSAHTIYARVFDTDSNMVATKLISVISKVLAPTNLNVLQITNNTVMLTWDDNSRIESGFEIEQQISDGSFMKVSSVGASVTRDTIFNLVDGLVYTYRVRAVSKSKSSVYTAEITVIVGPNSPNMSLVQGGIFTMGDSVYASPMHAVTVNSFFISKTEVTQKQYKAIMESNPSNFSVVGENAPVEGITWFDCISYCNKLSVIDGKTPCYSIGGNTNPSDWMSGIVDCDFKANGYRLPTEAEWEFAAKGGEKSLGYTYCGDNAIDDAAWYLSNSGNTTHRVSTKIANELGLYDMSGNVWEWCWDWYGNYSSTVQSNPIGIPGGSYRVLRGGSYFCSYAFNCLPVFRADSDPDNKYYDVGFRVAASAY